MPLQAMINATAIASGASNHGQPSRANTSDASATRVTRMSLAVCDASASRNALPNWRPRRRSYHTTNTLMASVKTMIPTIGPRDARRYALLDQC